jgi:hypothetical protein
VAAANDSADDRRFELRFDVQYEGYMVERAAGGLSVTVAGHVCNVSSTGLQFYADTAIAVGKVLEIEVDTGQGKQLQGRVEVVWSRTATSVIGDRSYSAAMGLRAVAD